MNGYSEALTDPQPRKRRRAKAQQSAGGEQALIQLIRERARAQHLQRDLPLGIGDDCAIVRPRVGEDMVVTTDFSLEGRHFRRDWHSARTIGHRALARGLSDLAAMGARPVAAFLSLALPSGLGADRAWITSLLDGLLHLADRAGVPLAGGDTAEAPREEVLIDIVLLGAVPRAQALRRDGARAGDRLVVTGSLGGAAAQLAWLQKHSQGRPASDQSGPHFLPEPQLRAGWLLARRKLATAAIDLSDGLSTDLAHLCTASGLRAEVHAPALPLDTLLRGLPSSEALQLVLHGGEDYQLLFTVPGGARLPKRLGGVRLTEIGRMLPRAARRPQMTILDERGRARTLRPGGWEHFA